MEVSSERLRADPQSMVIELGEDQGNVTGLHVQNVSQVSGKMKVLTSCCRHYHCRTFLYMPAEM
jgi:hypothetical protein